MGINYSRIIAELMFYCKRYTLSASAYVRARTAPVPCLDSPPLKGYPVDNGGEKWG